MSVSRFLYATVVLSLAAIIAQPGHAGESTWKVVSARLTYDAGGGRQQAFNSNLVLNDDGTYQFCGVRGTFKISPIEDSDWKRWGTRPYGPKAKIVLSGGGDGPIEESSPAPAIWIINRVGPPSSAAPGTLSLKFARSSAAPSTASAAAAAPAMQEAPATFAGRYVRMTSDSSLEKWDFSTDGTYLRTWMARGAGAYSSTAERGRYRIEGSTIHMQVSKSTTAYGAQTGSNRHTIGGGSDDGSETRAWRIQLLGDNGAAGIILNGTTFKPRSW